MSESRRQHKERNDEGYVAEVSFINIVIFGKYEKKTNVFAVYPLTWNTQKYNKVKLEAKINMK